ncbi:MAG TPA: hypothetical protein VMV05_12200 [bacterium]|nr:hypothetical protein [bacterium]
MKKFIVALMTVLFLGSTTGLVLADDAAPAATPVVKTKKVSHKSKHMKKVKKEKPAAAAPAPAATPAAK